LFPSPDDHTANLATTRTSVAIDRGALGAIGAAVINRSAIGLTAPMIDPVWGGDLARRAHDGSE